MNEKKQSMAIPLAIIFAGAMIAFGVYMSGGGPKESSIKQEAVPDQFEIREIGIEDYVLGNRKAPIVIVEYSDIECPYCKIYHETLGQLMEEYGTSGKLARSFRHFPVHTNSIKEAEAAECAGELGGNDAFWKYLDEAFKRTESNNGLDLEELPEIAREIGLDKEVFNSCLASGKYEDKIKGHMKEATDAGAVGTPYSVLFAKGERIALEELYPYKDLKIMIEAILKEI